MTSPTEGAPPINHWWTAQPGDAGRLARSLVFAGLSQPRQVITQGILAAALIIAIVVLGILGYFAFVIAGVVGLIYLAVWAPWAALRKARIHFERIAFPGAQWAVGYGSTSLVLHQPIASAVVDYSTFSSVRAGHGDTVVLRYADPRLALVLPDALCPPQACDFLSAAIHRHR